MTSKNVKGVLDMTFMDIREETAFQEGLTERMTMRYSSPSKTRGGTHAENTAAHDATSAPSPARKRKEEITAIRLANNMIDKVDIIYSSIASSGQVDPTKVLWLDLSFNNISSISVEFLANFPNLTTLYLHANNISKLSEIRKFQALPSLTSLSLYGNPVEEHKHYRNFTMYCCPKLHCFDMSPVIKSEKLRMEVWSRTFRKKLEPQDDDE